MFSRTFLLLSLLLNTAEIESLYLYDLDPNDGYLGSGKQLMDLDFGLHDLEPGVISNEIIIGIHGRDSRGFEWIYPLQKIDSNSTKTYFLRWNTAQCPQKIIPTLVNKIMEIQDIKKITILGHSYGGILSSLLLNEIEDIETEIHVIAAPLASNLLRNYCNYNHPTTKNSNISYFQWRTIKKLDFAFNSFDYDPQVLDFKESSVVRLPDKYRGNRLGHLWSISWVADNITQ